MNDVHQKEKQIALPGSSGPKISVVVATFNRRELLSRLLKTLSEQTFSPDQFEVIVVSDGSTDGTVDMICEFKGRIRNLEILDLTNRGPGAARNAGARVARGKILAFTDDDCLAVPDWLEQLVSAFERTGAVGVQGRTTTDRSARTPLTHQIEILKARLTSMPTCNAAYLKSVFDTTGGFDESFKFAHDEDADLAWRVEDLGRMAFVPEAHIIHPPRQDKFMKRAHWVRGLESEFLLYQKNPDKYRRYVKSPSPWWTIYWKVFVIGQLEWLKSCFKYLVKPFRPSYFFIGTALLAVRWFNLIRFLPKYWRAQSLYRSKFS